MGRIKSTAVKRTAKQLLQMEPSFSEDFIKNKKMLCDTMPSKPIRNKVAGDMVRLTRIKREFSAK